MAEQISRDDARAIKTFINATDGLVAMAGDASDVYEKTLRVVKQDLHEAIHATLLTLALKLDTPEMWHELIHLLSSGEVANG